MKALLDKNLIYKDNIVEMFRYDDIQEPLNEDLLKWTTGILGAGLSMAIVKAVSVHNIMAIKAYMKKVTDLIINGNGKSWKEPTYKSIVNDEKRNALMIAFQMAKYAGIYDFAKKDSMPNSYVEMPKIAGGSDKNFKELLKKRTKWFGLKTVADPLKNLNSIKPERNEDPNAYFTAILEQYRNALKRTFGETEAKKITDAINNFKHQINNAATDFENLTGMSFQDALNDPAEANNRINASKDPRAAREAFNRAKEHDFSSGIKEGLIKIFDNIIGSHDMSEYTIFKDFSNAIDNLISIYDKNINEAISNNRNILDKKLKKDGLLALWAKYMNVLRTAKQQVMDEFNKSPEYTYLRDFLRGTMLGFLGDLMSEDSSEEDDYVQPSPEDDNDDEDDDIVNPEDDIEYDFSTEWKYVGDPTNESAYQYNDLARKLYEKEFGKSAPKKYVDFIIRSNSNKDLGKILSIFRTCNESEIEDVKKELVDEFKRAIGATQEDVEVKISRADLDMESNGVSLNYRIDNSEMSEKTIRYDLNSKEMTSVFEFNYDDANCIVSASFQIDSNDMIDSAISPVFAEFIYESQYDEEEDVDPVEPEDDEDVVDPEDDIVEPEDDEEVIDPEDDEDVVDPEDEDDENPDNPEEDSYFIVEINKIPIKTSLESVEYNASSMIADKAATSVSLSEYYDFEIEGYGNDMKSALIIFSDQVLKDLKSIQNAYKENAITIFSYDSDKNDGYFKSVRLGDKHIRRFVSIIPRNVEAKKPISYSNVLMDLARIAEFKKEENKNLPVKIETKAELTKNNEFRIAFANGSKLAKTMKMCAIVLSSNQNFINQLDSSKERYFKSNIDAIQYNASERFKILDQGQDFLVVLMNFGDDTSVLNGVKFNKNFISFNPGDTIYYKIYPVERNGNKLNLRLDMASPIGQYTYQQKSYGSSQPSIENQKVLPNNQKQLPSSK